MLDFYEDCNFGLLNSCTGRLTCQCSSHNATGFYFYLPVKISEIHSLREIYSLLNTAREYLATLKAKNKTSEIKLMSKSRNKVLLGNQGLGDCLTLSPSRIMHMLLDM